LLIRQICFDLIFNDVGADAREEIISFLFSIDKNVSFLLWFTAAHYLKLWLSLVIFLMFLSFSLFNLMFLFILQFNLFKSGLEILFNLVVSEHRPLHPLMLSYSFHIKSIFWAISKHFFDQITKFHWEIIFSFIFAVKFPKNVMSFLV